MLKYVTTLSPYGWIRMRILAKTAASPHLQNHSTIQNNTPSCQSVFHGGLYTHLELGVRFKLFLLQLAQFHKCPNFRTILKLGH